MRQLIFLTIPMSMSTATRRIHLKGTLFPRVQYRVQYFSLIVGEHYVQKYHLFIVVSVLNYVQCGILLGYSGRRRGWQKMISLSPEFSRGPEIEIYYEMAKSKWKCCEIFILLSDFLSTDLFTENYITDI